MAPESIVEGTYSEKTDTYSFGIVCFEILTRKAPYAEMDNVTAARKIVQNRQRPTLTASCPETLSSLLNACWHHQPDQRPDFKQICAHLRRILRQTSKGSDTEDEGLPYTFSDKEEASPDSTETPPVYGSIIGGSPVNQPKQNQSSPQEASPTYATFPSTSVRNETTTDEDSNFYDALPLPRTSIDKTYAFFPSSSNASVQDKDAQDNEVEDVGQSNEAPERKEIQANEPGQVTDNKQVDSST